MRVIDHAQGQEVRATGVSAKTGDDVVTHKVIATTHKRVQPHNESIPAKRRRLPVESSAARDCMIG
jgi:hypothetical protein